jgi:hypothetical protein
MKPNNIKINIRKNRWAVLRGKWDDEEKKKRDFVQKSKPSKNNKTNKKIKH